MFKFIALLSGFLFGSGMIISGMNDPANVISFLDVFGNWSPDLVFVIGGALLVFAPSYWIIIHKMSQPIVATNFNFSNNKSIDIKLISGSALFGMGWGVAGICPGPALSSLAHGNMALYYFVIAMIVGLLLGDLLFSKPSK